MKELTADELRKLEYGQKVYRFTNGRIQGFCLVGRMPECHNYLIFSAGEQLRYLHISDKDEFRDIWFDSYDTESAGKLIIEYYEERIESIKKIYNIE
jgi:hypothetical protein